MSPSANPLQSISLARPPTPARLPPPPNTPWARKALCCDTCALPRVVFFALPQRPRRHRPVFPHCRVKVFPAPLLILPRQSPPPARVGFSIFLRARTPFLPRSFRRAFPIKADFTKQPGVPPTVAGSLNVLLRLNGKPGAPRSVGINAPAPQISHVGCPGNCPLPTYRDLPQPLQPANRPITAPVAPPLGNNSSPSEVPGNSFRPRKSVGLLMKKIHNIGFLPRSSSSADFIMRNEILGRLRDLPNLLVPLLCRALPPLGAKGKKISATPLSPNTKIPRKS